jgi:hypothetical protein
VLRVALVGGAVSEAGHQAILHHFGAQRGQRIVDAVAAGPDLVFELILRHGIECWADALA